MTESLESRRCPRCGEGVLIDITYRSGSEAAGEPIQEAETRQVESYSCGHEVEGPSLDRTAAGSEALEAERRRSDETTEPP